MTIEEVWTTLDEQVASGRLPGYVAAVRLHGDTHVHAGGRRAIESDAVGMTGDTLFRIASLTKPMGAALTLSLVEDGVLSLDEPAAKWLPEIADPRVLTSPEARLDSTVPAAKPVTVRHLITFTAGWGAVLLPSPLQQAMFDRNVFPGPSIPPMPGDEFLARVAELPLLFQPGEGWMYDTCMDLLGILLSRATGKPLSTLFAECVARPLGMESTGFWAKDVGRLATAYRPASDGLEVSDAPDGAFASPPGFEELGSGVVSTAEDVLRFFCAMADGGAPVLKKESVAAMTSDQLSEEQRRQAEPIVGAGASWSYGTAVDVEPVRPWMARGRWGWNGGTGTTGHVDPTRDVIGVLLTQREMTGAQDAPEDFWTALARAAE